MNDVIKKQKQIAMFLLVLVHYRSAVAWQNVFYLDNRVVAHKMSFQNWFGKRHNGFKSNRQAITIKITNKGNRQQQLDNADGGKHQNTSSEDISIIYLANSTPIETVLILLQSINENEAKVSPFVDES